MANESLVNYIVGGGAYEQGKQQVYKDLADMAYGAPNAKLQAEDTNLQLQSDIQAQKANIASNKILQEQGVPKTADGLVDYRALANMVAPANPKLGIDYSKEADNQDKIRETAKKDAIKSQIDGIKAMSDDLSAVTDQPSLDAFLTKAKALQYPLPPNFPQQYTPQTAGAIAAAGKVYAGAQKDMETQLKQQQIATQKADETRAYAEANRAVGMLQLDRDADARARNGSDVKPPSGYERDPDRPGALRPIAGGPSDPTTVSAKRDARSTQGGIYKDQLVDGLGLAPEHASEFSEKEAGLLLDDAKSVGELQTTRNYIAQNGDQLRALNKKYSAWKNIARNFTPGGNSFQTFLDSDSNDLDDNTVAFGKNLVVASTNIGKRLSGTNRIPISDQRIAQKLVEGAAVTPQALTKVLDDSIAAMSEDAAVKYGVKDLDKRTKPVDLGKLYGKSAPVQPAPTDPAQRKANTQYSTPKGVLTWTGTGWTQ